MIRIESGRSKVSAEGVRNGQMGAVFANMCHPCVSVCHPLKRCTPFIHRGCVSVSPFVAKILCNIRFLNRVYGVRSATQSPIYSLPVAKKSPFSFVGFSELRNFAAQRLKLLQETMEKIFTRYVLLSLLLSFSGIRLAQADDIVDPVLIDEDFSSDDFAVMTNGQVQSLHNINEWSFKGCLLLDNPPLYDKSIKFENPSPGSIYGTANSPTFGIACNAVLKFRYAPTTASAAEIFVTIGGSGSFDKDDSSAKTVSFKTKGISSGVFADGEGLIYGAKSDTYIIFEMKSSNNKYFVIDDVKVTASTPVTISETGTATTFDAQLADVTLGRTLSADVWSTLCLPFDVTTEAMQTATGATDVKMCTFTSYADGTMTFEKKGTVTAGKPFLVKVNTTVENPRFLLVDVKSTAAQTETHGDVSMVGCYGQTDLNTDGERVAVFLTADGTLKRPNSASSTMNGLRAYFLVPSSFPGARVMIDDEEVTAIDAVLKPESTGDGELYSLTGQRQTQSVRPGIYINNGKKVIIK